MSPRSNAWADFALIVVAIFLPPVAVAFKRGLFSADFLINVALCILGFLPGLVHAVYLVAKYPIPSRLDGGENQPLL